LVDVPNKTNPEHKEKWEKSDFSHSASQFYFSYYLLLFLLFSGLENQISIPKPVLLFSVIIVVVRPGY
jgi:hypothetical protein